MVTIRLHNTKTRRKEVFTPIDPAQVRMYVCGPTVYDRAHLGNARPVVVFDTLYRLLRHVYGADHVTYVRNFTDVDDKINATALARQQAGAAGTAVGRTGQAARGPGRARPRAPAAVPRSRAMSPGPPVRRCSAPDRVRTACRRPGRSGASVRAASPPDRRRA